VEAAGGDAFDVFVERILGPSLTPGQLVIWDNLSVHKSAVAARLLAAQGCRVLFLPPYSPDFAPIEQAFSKLKTALRRSGARTRAALEAAIAAALATITTPTPTRGSRIAATPSRPNSYDHRSRRPSAPEDDIVRLPF
jgi:transposase